MKTVKSMTIFFFKKPYLLMFNKRMLLYLRPLKSYIYFIAFLCQHLLTHLTHFLTPSNLVGVQDKPFLQYYFFMVMNQGISEVGIESFLLLFFIIPSFCAYNEQFSTDFSRKFLVQSLKVLLNRLLNR